MKKALLLFSLLIFIFSVSGQITILSSDLGETEDTVRYSNATILNPSNIIATDTNYTWDFSQLSPISQTPNKYVKVNSTSLVFAMAFGAKANLASPQEDIGIQGIGITDPYAFYDKNTSYFSQVGLGGTVSLAPIPIPIVFKSPDVLYQFPLEYKNTDSSFCEWEIALPGTGYLAETIDRTNEVDGWGTIITPFGTFECLRLKSSIIQEDTFYLEAVGMGMRIPQQLTEYIWLSKNMKFPIMKATVSALGITQVQYMDKYIPFTGIESTNSTESFEFELLPNPTLGVVNITTNFPSQSSIEIFDIQGKVVHSAQISPYTNHTLETSEWAKGIYVVRVNNKSQQIIKRLIVQ